ncbi:MAG: DUF1289 domain-containing protein [Alphaproteobacteria bacterium]|nr:DUF1289 domain-containing protein [Alphaproteobacteria bacterium]
MTSVPVATPCISVCQIDPRSQLCRGCGRNLREIGGWLAMSPQERERVMAELPQRMRAEGLGALAPVEAAAPSGR